MSWDGLLDDVRIYNRALTAAEIAELAAGNHTTAIWDGSSSTDWETAANWDINAVPDPFTHVIVRQSGSGSAVLSASVSGASLTIESGASLDLHGFDFELTDSGALKGGGTLRLRGDETLGNIVNSGTGTVLYYGSGSYSGLAAGNTYNNLTIEDPTEDGLVGYWKFDEGARNSCVGGAADVCDHSGNGNHGTRNGAGGANNLPQWTTTKPTLNFGNPYAMDFDGMDDYVHMSSNPLSGLSVFTVSLWIKSDLNESGAAARIISNGLSDDWDLAINRSGSSFNGIPDGHLMQFIRNDLGWADLGDVSGATEWTHIGVSVQNGSQIAYANGIEVGSLSKNFSSSWIDGVFILMDRFNHTDGTHNGQLDDVRIYNRALSAAEIANLAAGSYASGANGTATFTLDAALDVNADLTLVSGSLSAGSNAIDVAGDWNNYAGTGAFIAGTSTVDFDGSSTQNVRGSTNFYRLEISTSTARTVKFGSGTTQGISNALTLTGQAAQLLTIGPLTAGTKWFLDVASALVTQTLSYLSVSWSDASPGETITADDGTSTDGGNNVNWTFSADDPDPPTITSPASGSLLNDATPTISGTGSTATNTIRAYSGSTVLCTTTVNGDASKSWSCDSSSLVDGMYVIHATEGNGTESAASATVTFTVDTEDPAAPGTPDLQAGSDTGTSSTDNITSDTTPTFTVSCETDATVSLLSGATVLGTGTCASSTVSITSSALVDGLYAIKASQEDGAGNVSSQSSALSVTIDATAATLAEVTPVPTPTGDNTPSYTFSSTEAGTISYGGDCASGTTSASSGNNTVTFNALIDGEHANCTITVTDAAGNASPSLSVTAFTVDTAAPTIETLSPADGATDVSTTANFVITFSEAVDPQSGNVTIYAAADDSQVEQIDVTSGQVTGGGTDTITVNPSSSLSNSTAYYIQIDATAFDDTSGNSFAGISDETTWNITTVAASVTPSGGGGGGGGAAARQRRERNAAGGGGGGGGGLTYSDTVAPTLQEVGIADDVTTQVTRQTGYINDPTLHTFVAEDVPRRVNAIIEALTLWFRNGIAAYRIANMPPRQEETATAGCRRLRGVCDLLPPPEEEHDGQQRERALARREQRQEEPDAPIVVSLPENDGRQNERAIARAEQRQEEPDTPVAISLPENDGLQHERAVARAEQRQEEPADAPVAVLRLTPALIGERRGLLVAQVKSDQVLYSDVPIDAWFAPYVASLITQEIATGYADDEGKPTGTFGVEDPVTYAEVLKMALEAAKKDIGGLPPPRNVSAQGTWASAYVALGETLRLSVLSPDRDVHAPATRGEVIQTILQVLGIPTGIKIASPFADVASDHPYMPAITTAAAFGLVTGDVAPDGTPLGTFRPNDQINRAEVAKIIALTKALLP